MVSVWEDSVVAIPAAACVRHQDHLRTLASARTYGDLRTAGITDVDDYDQFRGARDLQADEAVQAGRVTEEQLEGAQTDQELYELIEPLDSDPLPQDHPALVGLDGWDWRPTAAIIEEFGDLLGDLGVPDQGSGIDYDPLPYEIPAEKMPDVVKRLISAGYEVAEVDDIDVFWS